MAMITPDDAFINSRDAVLRVEELELTHADPMSDSGGLLAAVYWDADDRAEWESLSALVAACEENADYERHVRDGMSLVHEAHWVQACQEQAEELYGGDIAFAVPSSYGSVEWVAQSWDDVLRRAPFDHINWESYAAELRGPTPEIEWEGVTFLIMQ